MPPCQGLYLAGTPPNPLIAITKGQFQCWGSVCIVIITSGGCPCPRQKLLHLGIKLRRVSQAVGLLCPGQWLRVSSLMALPLTRTWWEDLLYFGVSPRAGLLEGNLPCACLLMGSLLWTASGGTHQQPVDRGLSWVFQHLQLWGCQWVYDHLWLQHCPWETCCLTCSMWPSRRCAAMSAWWCMSCATTRASSYDSGLTCLYRVWASDWDFGGGLALGTLTESHCSSNWACSYLCQRHSFTDSNMDWWILSAVVSSQGLSPGNLFNEYTSL